MPDSEKQRWAYRVRDWVLLVFGMALVGVGIGLVIAEREDGMPMITSGVGCWAMVPALRHKDRQP